MDRDRVPQSILNIDRKERSNLLPWSGQFSPQLVEALLKTYGTRNGTVLDPFGGSGTVVCECAREGNAACMAEINPAAHCLASLYHFMNTAVSRREVFISRFEHCFLAQLPCDKPLFAADEGSSGSGIESWYARLRDEFRGTPLEILLNALVVLSDIGVNGQGRPNLISTWNKIKSVVRALPHSDSLVQVWNCDARALPLDAATVDLVITSPPYVNVFNYHQQYRTSTELLGWDLLNVARCEIGSNRKNRGNRFLTVVQYCLDMGQVFSELLRVSKEIARIIFVVGRESRVRGVPFWNAEIVARVATQCGGLTLAARQERVFKNKFGAYIFEDILHFVRSPRADATTAVPQDIAMSALEEACAEPPATNAMADIRDAIDRIPDVKPSPVFQRDAARIAVNFSES